MWAAIGLVLLLWASSGPGDEPLLSPRPAGPTTPCGAVGLLFGRPIDLNVASAESLQALPGIGPSRAAAIVEERGRAPFGRVEDLQRVRGVGPRTVEGLAGWVGVGSASRDPC